MLAYTLKRLLALIPVLIGVSLLVFASLYLTPGDPLSAILGEAVVSKEQMEQLREQYGFDDPLYVQYLRFAGRALQGDLGRSLRYNQPVLQQIRDQLPATIQLALAAMAFAVLLGISLGVLAAIYHNTWVDFTAMLVALAGISIPTFWSGLLLLLIFALELGWLPATGTEGWQRLIMPAFALGYGAAAIIARLTRSSMLEVLRQSYVTTARAKGLPGRIVVLRHTLKNALIPVITIVGLQFGNLLAGAVVVETVFSRQGIGRLLVDAILSKDFPTVQGTVLLVAVIYVLINLLVDLSYAMVDPRIRYS
jgi:ABC-type dipeptide/oligopeptide/nickel transport system permease component